MTTPTRTRDAERTRGRILEVARVRFGRDGYDRTSVRGVAADAEVDPALVLRYFGSKEGLFARVIEFDLHLPDLTGVPPEQLGHELLPHFFRVWEDESAFLPLLRAAASSEAAAATMRRVFTEQVAPALAAVTPDHHAERAALVGTQVLGLAFLRYVVGAGPLAAMSREQVADWVGPVIERYLTGSAPA